MKTFAYMIIKIGILFFILPLLYYFLTQIFFFLTAISIRVVCQIFKKISFVPCFIIIAFINFCMYMYVYVYLVITNQLCPFLSPGLSDYFQSRIKWINTNKTITLLLCIRWNDKWVNKIIQLTWSLKFSLPLLFLLVTSFLSFSVISCFFWWMFSLSWSSSFSCTDVSPFLCFSSFSCSTFFCCSSSVCSSSSLLSQSEKSAEKQLLTFKLEKELL